MSSEIARLKVRMQTLEFKVGRLEKGFGLLTWSAFGDKAAEAELREVYRMAKGGSK